MGKKEKLKSFQARIKYPAYFAKKSSFFGSWHTIKALNKDAVVKEILKGTVGLSRKRVQVRKKK